MCAARSMPGWESKLFVKGLRRIPNGLVNTKSALRSGEIDGVSEDIVNRLIAGLASAGDLDDLDAEIERFQQFRDAGLTELSLRLHDDPMDALKLITERVLPAVQ